MNQVFVDLENVPNVELALIRDHAAHVTLLIGEKQRRLELEFVRQIHAHAAQVSLVEVGTSGRNALDMVLACYLGSAVERSPKDTFFVVSKDKDFDPLLKHLRARGLEASRVDSFAALPFAAAPVTEAPKRRRTKTAVQSKPVEPPRELELPLDDPRLPKVITCIQRKDVARPVRRKTLLSHINSLFGNQLSAPALEGMVSSLQDRGIISIDANGRVTYPQT